MPRAQRMNRLEMPSVEITFRGAINLSALEVYREDQLLSMSGDRYRVLDLAMVERVEPRTLDSAPDDDEVWAATGALAVEIQRIGDDGEGLALPTFKEITGDDGGIIAWAGWTLVPCSPRRDKPACDEPIDVDAGDLAAVVTSDVCVICGSPDVAHVDAGGNALCASHIGESPEAPE